MGLTTQQEKAIVDLWEKGTRVPASPVEISRVLKVDLKEVVICISEYLSEKRKKREDK